MEDIVVAKLTSMVVLGGAAFIVTLVPVLVNKYMTLGSPQVKKKNTASDFVLSLFLSFGGGVLLCTTFLHLLPEVSENIGTLKSNNKIPEDFPLPLPELIMCCGFFVMYIVEEVVHKFLHSWQEKKGTRGRENLLQVSAATLADPDLTMTEVYREVLKQDSLQVTFSPPHEEDIQIYPKNIKTYGTSPSRVSEVNHNIDSFHDLHYGHDHQHHKHNNHQHDHAMLSSEPPSLREFLLVLALTVHEAFEGLAIGLEGSVGAVWYLMAAVAVHKCVIAFCIGVELVSGHISIPLSVFYAFIYSCASPFGIGIGLLMCTSNEDDPMVLLSVVLQGMATGTLLYVVFFEILKKDGHDRSGLAKMIVVILGFTSMAAITVFLND